MATRWSEADLSAFQARTRSSASASTARVPSASQALPAKAQRAKYGNRKVVDASGAVHDSTKEHRRWQELQLEQVAGRISLLRRQVPFALVANGVLVCQYIADFVYVEGDATIVEDCKSPPTRKLPAYRIKVKLMQALHGIQIREV